MYLKYGDFQFHPWEATLSSVSIQARYTPRNFKLTQIVQMFASGDVVAADQYATGTRLAAIRDAIAFDGYDFGLYHDDNTPTVHFLDSDHPTNITGNQIFFKNFPSDAGAEYISGRQFAFGVKAEIADNTTSIIEYKDTYRAIGNCGPIFDWRNTPAGIRVDRDAPNSVQMAVHSGFAVTTNPWFLPPAPYYPAPFHLGHIQSIAYEGPVRYPQGYSGYTTRWTYHYALPVDTFNTPTIR